MIKCFVIGPIGDRFAAANSLPRQTYEDALEVLEKVIEPACEVNGLTAVRADQIAATGDINDQVFRHLRDDDLVIADVSGANANVMYELGARHTLKKLTIQLGEYGQLPFDIRAIRTIEFSRSRRGLIDARMELEQAIATGMAEEPETLPLYRVWQEGRGEQFPIEEGGGGDLLIGDEEQRVDGEEGSDAPLDSMGVVEEAFLRLQNIAADIGETLEAIAALITDATAEAEKADLRSGTATARLAVIGMLAQQLDQPTSTLETLTSEYANDLDQIDRSMAIIIAYLENNLEETRDARVQSFLVEIGKLAQTARDSMESINIFGTSAEGMGGISKRLRGPGRRLAVAAKQVSTATSKIDEWERRTAPLISEAA